MSTYLKQGKPLEYDNAPDWLVAHMKYRRIMLGNTPNSVMTFFVALREFFQWVSAVKRTGRQPQSREELQGVDILALPLQTAVGVTKNDIETYMFFLMDVLGNEAVTRGKKLVAIRCFYDYIIDQQEELGIRIGTNPASRIPSPKKPKKQPVFLPEADQTALLESITGDNACRDYCMALLMLTAGLRISELTGIDINDVDLKSMTIRIRGKGNKERLAHLTPPCCTAIQKYRDGYRDLINGLETDALFVSKKAKARLTNRAVEKFMAKHFINAKLGGNHYTPHKLRHSTATTLAKGGCDLLTIQKVLGHASPATTEIYTHLAMSDIASAVSQSSLSRLGMAPQENTNETE